MIPDPGPDSAPEMEPIPTDAYYDVTRITEVAVSPGGDRVAFLAVDSEPEEDSHRTSLFVAPTDGSREPHRLTRASDAGSPAWSPDGTRLAFTAAREEDLELAVERGAEDRGEANGNGSRDEDDENDEEEGPIGEGPRSHVWVFDLELGGDARQVTTDESFPEGVSGFDWGPAGDRLVVAARDPTDEQREYLRSRSEEDGPVVTERLQHKGDGTGWLDEVRTYLFVVDVPTREARRLDDAYGGGALEFMTGVDPKTTTDRYARPYQAGRSTTLIAAANAITTTRIARNPTSSRRLSNSIPASNGSSDSRSASTVTPCSMRPMSPATSPSSINPGRRSIAVSPPRPCRATWGAAEKHLPVGAETVGVVDDSDGGSGGDPPAGGDPEPTGRKTDVLDALREGPTRFVPPRTEAARRELREGDREILHCLDCGRQVVARRHGGACLLCGSEAVIVESV